MEERLWLVVERLTRPASRHLVNMTMCWILYSHTILQKSDTVFGMGPGERERERECVCEREREHRVKGYRGAIAVP